jgi:hypothetical protein
MKPLSEADLRWLESRIGKHKWADEDRRRLLADLREARALESWWHQCADGVLCAGITTEGEPDEH